MPKALRSSQSTVVAVLLAISVTLPLWLSPALAAETAGKIETPGVTADRILIGSCSALTGSASQIALQQLVGAKTYLNYINNHGGINGRKLKLNEYDDGYDAEKAIDAFKHLLNDKCFVGAFFVGAAPAAKHVAMAETHGVPLVGLLTGAQPLHDPFRPHVFSVRASYFDETRELIDTMFKDLGNDKRIAVIYQDDAFGAAVLTGVKKALAKYGDSPVGLGSFRRNSTDVDGAIKEVREARPDVVVLVGNAEPLSQIARASHNQGWRPIFTTVSFIGTETFIKLTGKDGEGVIFTQVMPPYNRDDLPTIALYKRLLAKYYPTDKPSFASLEGFVDAMVLCDGLKLAGHDLTRDKFVAALESMHNRDLGLGSLHLSYAADRHKAFNSVYLTVIKNGQCTGFTSWRQLSQN